MGCYWTLRFGHLVIDSGNQNCDLAFLSLLLKDDFHLTPTPKCVVSANELRNRLFRCGYSTLSCQNYFREYISAVEKRKSSILFVTDDFICEDPWKDLSPFLRRLRIDTLCSIWSKLFKGCALEGNEKYLHMLVTNRFDAEYMDPYFDQSVNYFILTGICNEADVCLDMEEIFDWGYWTKDDFENDSLDYTLLTHTNQNALVRFSTVEHEENMQIEFKEVTDQSITNSIKKNLAKNAVAFLNTMGGAIFFGISDSGEVRGFMTDRGKRDEIANLAIKIISNITPRIPPETYSIKFIPIIENGQISNDLVCLCISFRANHKEQRYEDADGRIWFRQHGATLRLDI
jgi:hypothetical protein